MQYISVGRRFVAILIDGLISLVWVIPTSNIQTGNGQLHVSSTGPPFLLNVAIWIGYFTLFEALLGATPGKLAVGIRVVRSDGSKLDAGSALLRNVLRVVDAIPFVIPYLVAAVAVWNSPTRQRVGDRFARTVVIQAGTNRMAPPPSPPPPPPPPLPPLP